MALYSYVLRVDDGAAPNPYYGYCTLAICKPSIRRIAKSGDWVIGTGTSEFGKYKLIYAMKLTEKPITFQEYFEDPRFKRKKPNFRKRDKNSHLGDNIYKFTENGFKQLPSVHSSGSRENILSKEHDLGKKLQNNRVLVSDNFYYFGKKAIKLPTNLYGLVKKGQGHKSISISKSKIKEFEEFIKSRSMGINGEPIDELGPEDILDVKCKKVQRCGED